MKNLQCKDHLVSGKLFELVPHTKYAALLTHPIPEPLEPYYDHPDYISHQQESQGFFYALYGFLRRLNITHKLKLLNRVVSKKGNLLDFGAGTGAFVHAAQNEGWTAKGYDPLVHQGKQKENLFVSDWIKSKHYHCITAWHVLEHLPSPQDFLKQAHTSLTQKGVLVIALPNCASWDAQHYQADWAAYDVPRHLWHFTPKGIKEMGKEFGFELVQQHPLHMDAYYIALLSEKIQKNSFPWIRALINGTRSNCKANRTGMYSSLIYVFKKAK